MQGAMAQNTNFQYFYSTVSGLPSSFESTACADFPSAEVGQLFPWKNDLTVPQNVYTAAAHTCVIYWFTPPGFTGGPGHSGPCPASGGIGLACTNTALNERFNVASADLTTTSYLSGGWVPSVQFGGGSTGLVVAATGNFSVVGSYVEGDYEVSISNKGSSSGTITISGLPYLADNVNAANSGGGPVNSYSGFTALPGVPWMYVDTSNVLHMVYGTTTGFVSLGSSVLTNTAAFRGTFKYKIAQ